MRVVEIVLRYNSARIVKLANTQENEAFVVNWNKIGIIFFLFASVFIFSGALFPLIKSIQSQGLPSDTQDLQHACLFLALGGVGSIYLLRSIRVLPTVLLQVKSLTLFFILTLSSTMWSVLPLTSFANAVLGLCLVVVALVFAFTYTNEHFIKLIALIFGAFAIVSILMALFIPSVGIMDGFREGIYKGTHEGLWRGIFVHKNILAEAMAVGILCSFSAIFYATKLEKIGYGGIVIACSGVLVLSGSMTGILAPFLAIILAAFSLFFLQARFAKKLLVTGFLFLSTAVIGAFLNSNHVDMILNLLGKNSTLTDRLPIWSGVIDAIHDRPFLGYGYESFWSRSHDLASSYTGNYLTWIAPHAHNSFLDVMLALGLVGFTLFLFHYLGQFATLMKTSARPAKEVFFFFTIWWALLLFSLTESVVAREGSLWFVYLCITFRIAHHHAETHGTPHRRPNALTG